MPSVTKKRVRKIKDDSNEQALLFLFFWGAVLVESIALYKRTYLVYGIARMFVVPVLLLRIFRSPGYRDIGMYFFFFLALSFFADALTAFGNYSLASIGLSLYSLGYLCLGCWFQHLKNNHYSNLIFITTLLLLAMLHTLWMYAPELHRQSLIALVGVHCLSILYAVYGALSIYGKNNPSLFLSGVAAIVFTNLLYGIDMLHYHQTHSWLDALVGFGNGMYLFLLTKGVLRIEKKPLLANIDFN